MKTVTNDNGGTALPDGLDADGDRPAPRSPGRPEPAAVTNAVVNAGTYALSETGGPTGYTASAWTCTGGTLTGTSVAVTNGGNVTCTINNNDQPATLTLVKTVDNGDTGATAVPADWTLSATGPTPVSGALATRPRSPHATVNAGTYTLSETGGPAGYTASAWTCTGGTVTASSVAIANGGDVTCTITNNAQPASLTLVKTVTNDNGGTAVPTDWTLTADGPTPGSPASPATPTVTDAPVSSATTTSSEAGGPAGYTAGTGPAPAPPLNGRQRDCRPRRQRHLHHHQQRPTSARSRWSRWSTTTTPVATRTPADWTLPPTARPRSPVTATPLP